MEHILFILVAIAVAALAWAILYAVTEISARRKRRLKERLSTETHSHAGGSRTLVLQSQSTGLPEILAGLGPIQALQGKVSQAFPEMPLARFLLIAVATSSFAFITVWLISDNPVVATVAAVLGIFLPFFVVSFKRSRRQKVITAQLPEALDFLSRVLRAGQSFSTGLQMMSDELPQPLAGEFRRCYDQHSLGQPIEDGLREMAIRLDSPDFAFFATAVVIQRQSGGDMAEVLYNISQMIRQRLRLQQSVRAKTAEGRFTGYIMLGFPVVMFFVAWILNPEYGSTLVYNPIGHILLGIAVGLQLLGLYLIKRITTVRV